MGMKGKFENIKSRINKQAATDEAFVQFCNNEVNLRRLRHVNWWFVNESDFPNNNVILMLLQKPLVALDNGSLKHCARISVN